LQNDKDKHFCEKYLIGSQKVGNLTEYFLILMMFVIGIVRCGGYFQNSKNQVEGQ